VHYAGKKAPWNGFEDTGIPAAGTHGTDLFKTHPELPGIIVDWFVTTLIATPGHAPAEPLACASILNQLELPGGVAQVTKQLEEARRRDPKAQLFPEVVVTILGYDHLAVGETKLAVEIMRLVVTAYTDSADAYDSLSDAYLADGQKDSARQTAEKALALLDSHTAPESSWSDTEARRKLIRDGAQDNLKQLGTPVDH
jgi:tetratricopeptide (TPR) repeat protein